MRTPFALHPGAVAALLATVAGALTLSLDTAALAARRPKPPRLFLGNADDTGTSRVNIFTIERVRSRLRRKRIKTLLPYKGSGRGATRVAGGRLNGDALADLLVGRGPGQVPEVRGFDGKQLRELRGALGRINAFQAAFRGGVYVALGDVDRDELLDIIVSVGSDVAPQINVFSGATGQQLTFFEAFDSKFTGGVRVASGDVNGDGFDDIIAGAGPGAGPHVRVISGENGDLLHDFDAFAPEFGGGVFVAAGDVNGDGRADIVVGAGAGGGPQVRVFNGVGGAELRSFLAYPASFTGGVTVAAGDVNGDGSAEIITGQASAGGLCRIFNAANGGQLDSFFAFGQAYQGGVNVGFGE